MDNTTENIEQEGIKQQIQYVKEGVKEQIRQLNKMLTNLKVIFRLRRKI